MAYILLILFAGRPKRRNIVIIDKTLATGRRRKVRGQ
jgi:hypothetical protein